MHASKKSAARKLCQESIASTSLSDFISLIICREAGERKFKQSLSTSRFVPGFVSKWNNLSETTRYIDDDISLVQFCAPISLLRKSGRSIVNGISFAAKIHSAAASNTLLSARTAGTIRELISTQHTDKSYRECVYGEKSLMISSRDNHTGKRDDQTTVYTLDAYVISLRVSLKFIKVITIVNLSQIVSAKNKFYNASTRLAICVSFCCQTVIVQIFSNRLVNKFQSFAFDSSAKYIHTFVYLYL